MTGIVFPLLQLSVDSISSFRDEESFRRAVCMTTDKALKAGFFNRARLIDANLIEFRVEQLELVGRSSLLGWMRRGREIKELTFATEGRLELSRIKALVASTIKNSAFWADNDDQETIVTKIEASRTFSELTGLFG